MASESISAHVVVISQSSGKLPDGKGNSQSSAPSGTDFANLLAAQIQGDAPVAAVPVTASGDLPEGGEKPGFEPDISALTAADPTLAQPAADGQNPQPIVYLQGVQLDVHVQVQACCGDRGDASPLEGNVLAAKPLTPATTSVIDAKPNLEQAATDIADPAKIAAGDKSLPIETLREVKTETVNTAPTTHAAQVQRTVTLPTAQAPVALPVVEVPVGQAGWDNAFSQRVLWVASNNQQVAHLQLNPPHLGPVEIRIALNNEQTTAAFTSPHAAVREAIEAALPRLRDMLADNGLSLGNVNVSSQSFQQQQHAREQGNHNQRQDPFQELQRIASSGNPVGAVVQAGIASVLVNKGLVDTFV